MTGSTAALSTAASIFLHFSPFAFFVSSLTSQITLSITAPSSFKLLMPLSLGMARSTRV